MTCPKPHYLLFCDGNVSTNGENAGSQRGRWRFVLENLLSGERIEATDQEVACAPDRSALVAVLRGLEALEQPSRVTLVTTSRYVTRGLQYGLTEWRDNDYSWEHFGAVQPIRNADIWKRIDRALAYHQVQCRWMAQEAVADTQDESPSPKHDEARRATPGNKAVDVTCVDTGIEDGSGRCATITPQLITPQSQTPQSQTHRRSRTVEGTRSNVAKSKYQRIFVDTPLSTVSQVIESQNQPKKKSQKRMLSFVQICFLPIHLVRRGVHWLCCPFWDAILAIDEWLESFLRCLLLLDPSKKLTRR